MSTPVKPYRVPPPASPGSFHSTSHMVQARRGDDTATDRDVEATKDYAFFHSPKFKICFLSMCFNVVLFALDQFIITVAVPQIVSEFNALDQVEWLNTAFFIPCAGAILIYTQIMTIASPRWTYLASVFIFEVGSAICGSAQSMNMLIAGRAVSGLGGAGMWNATYLIGGEVIPFDKRPGFFGLFGVSYIFASVMGPLVGGALTDAGNSGWRWCFYINLPIGAITLVLLLLTLPSIPKLAPFDGKPDRRPIWQKLVDLDWVSAVLTLGFVTCLGVGLQWGGITKAWNDAGVITTLVLALVLFVALMGWSVVRGPKAMIPMSLLSRRHFSLGIWVSFFGYGSIVVYLYYIPLFLEAIKDKSAVRAGVLLLGFQLTMCPLLIIVGKLGERTGQAKITILIGFALVAVASGLLTLINQSSSIAQLVGFEAIAGIGYGSVLNIVVLLVQADYLKTPHLVPHVTNVLNFWGFVGRIIGMSTATNIFENKASGGGLRKGLGAMSSLDAGQIAEVSASPKAVWEVIPSEMRDEVLDIYSSSLDNVWWLCLAFAIAGLVSAVLMRNLNLKQLAEEAGKSINEANPPAYPLERVDDKQSSASAEGLESQPGVDNWKGA